LDELKVPVATIAATTVDFSSFRLSPSSSSFFLWHSSLGHVSSSCLRFLASVIACDVSNCSGCKLANFPLYLLIEVFMFLLHLLI